LAEVDASFESPPILSHGSLYLATSFDVAFALDAKTGKQQHMVVSAGAHTDRIEFRGDSVVAFALPN